MRNAAGPVGRLMAWLGGLIFIVSLAYGGWCYAVGYGRVALDFPQPGAVAGSLAANIGLFTAFAAHHSIMARSGAKRWLARKVAPPLERTLYVWVGSVLFLVTCAGWQEIPVLLYRADGVWQVPFRAVQLAGVWLTLRAAGAIDPLDLAGIRQAQGQTGSARFRVVGPYHVVRHPIYLGWVLMTFGTPAMTGTRLSFAAISTAYLIAAVPFEERSLVEAFGDEYRRYRARVRWRMIPGLY
jgi:protein-S-isoprenylcysteine O-methyltransferase Ste14